MPKQVVRSNRVPNPVGSFSPGTKAGPLMFLSPQVGIDPDTGKLVTSCEELSDEVGRSFATGRLAADSRSGPVQAQYWQLFKNIKTILEEHGASLDDILRVTMFVTNFGDLPSLGLVRSRPFAPKEPPPITMIGASALCVPGAEVQVEVVVALPREGGRREVVPAPRLSTVGHYLVATRTGQMAFALGLIAADGSSGKVIRGDGGLGAEGRVLGGGLRARDEIEERAAAQTFYILRDMQALLEDNGAALSAVVKTTVYLRDMQDLPAWERVYGTFFDTNPPPTTIIGCTGLGMKDFALEIECSAFLPGPEQSEMITTRALPSPITHSASLAKAGDLLFLSGQHGLDRETGRIGRGYGDLGTDANQRASQSLAIDWREGPAAAQTDTIFSNLRRALEEQGTSLSNLVQLNLFVTDARDIPVVERVAAGFFPFDPPACGIIQVPALPVRGAVVQADGIALLV